MRYDYDVIVVGGRVAGASTAMLLARRGHRVLVVDRVTLPSDTVSTHALLRTAVLQLTRWGVLDRIVSAGTPAISHITLGFGPERIPFRLKPDHDIVRLYAPRRFQLDAMLLEEAVRDGAEFAGATRVVGIVRDDMGRVAGVQTDHATITASWVIGADGIHSRVAQLVGAETLAFHPPANAIHYAYFTGVETPGYWFQFTTGVNAGIIPTDDGEACVFVGRPSHRFERFRAEPDVEFRRLLARAGSDLAERVAGGTRVSSFRGTPGLPGVVRQPRGRGWALVGDAGYAKDPISAHGISAALRDAELCARAIDGALRNPRQDEIALRPYHRVRDELSAPLFNASATLARYRWTAGEASTQMRMISKAVRRECDHLAGLDASERLMGVG